MPFSQYLRTKLHSARWVGALKYLLFWRKCYGHLVLGNFGPYSLYPFPQSRSRTMYGQRHALCGEHYRVRPRGQDHGHWRKDAPARSAISWSGALRRHPLPPRASLQAKPRRAVRRETAAAAEKQAGGGKSGRCGARFKIKATRGESTSEEDEIHPGLDG